MLSQEFIPSSPSDADFIAALQDGNNNGNSNNNPSNPRNNISISTSDSTISTVPNRNNFSTNPEGMKFIPQPPVQFYYSLQKNSLRTVIDTLLSAHELGYLCTVFKVPCYGRWLKKKRMVADLLVDFMLNLKQSYSREQFNELVEKINEMKGKDMLGRIPKLPEKVDALKVLRGSLSLINRIVRPNFPVRLNSPIKEVTGLIFLDEVNETNFTVDLFFTFPSGIESNNSNMRFILIIYQTLERIKSPNINSIHNTAPAFCTVVSPTLLDLTLNGTVLEQGNCRFRNHDSFDITLLCYKERANLLRIIRHETHLDLNHLIIEIVAINLAGSLTESRPITNTSTGGVKRTRDQINLEEVNWIREKYLKEDLIFEEVNFQSSFSKLKRPPIKESDDVQILEDSMKFSLKCPISFIKIRKPVKFKSCKHGQCFDLSSWQQITQTILNLRLSGSCGKSTKYTAKVTCPICGDNTEKDKNEPLIIDGMFKEFLKFAKENDSFVELSIKDGKFSFISEESESESDTETEKEATKKINIKNVKINQMETEMVSDQQNQDEESITNTNKEIICLTDSDSDDEIYKLLTYKVDKSKPIGSCPSRAITID